MGKFGEILTSQRKTKGISLKKAARVLKIKVDHLKALEEEDWQNLPDATFVKGFITSYANYLGLDSTKTLAIYRREYDEKKYPKAAFSKDSTHRLYLTPVRIINFVIILAIFLFIGYLIVQYSSVFSAPKLDVIAPKDDETVSVPVVVIEGKTDTQSTVSIEGEFVPVDTDGNFSYQLNLKDGKNNIEIISSKRLSPKSKITRTIRLVH